VTLQKYFSHPSLVFCKPIYKTKTETANRWETTNSKPPGPIIMIGQSETGSSSQIIFITLFSGRYTTSLCLFKQTVQQKCLAKTILLSQTSVFGLFSSSNFRLQGHILSTTGDEQLYLHMLSAYNIVSKCDLSLEGGVALGSMHDAHSDVFIN
jgi:hypothetical protein